MKNIFILLGAILMTGCLVCHKTETQTQPLEKSATQGFVERQAPVKEEMIITRHSILEAANFEFDSMKIRGDMNKMEELERDILANPKAVIFVEGHTDNVGPEEYNKALSLDRAKAVAEVLVKQKYPNKIQVHGAGSSMPIASNETAEGRAKNRRVDVMLLRQDTKK